MESDEHVHMESTEAPVDAAGHSEEPLGTDVVEPTPESSNTPPHADSSAVGITQEAKTSELETAADALAPEPQPEPVEQPAAAAEDSLIAQAGAVIENPIPAQPSEHSLNVEHSNTVVNDAAPASSSPAAAAGSAAATDEEAPAGQPANAPADNGLAATAETEAEAYTASAAEPAPSEEPKKLPARPASSHEAPAAPTAAPKATAVAVAAVAEPQISAGAEGTAQAEPKADKPHKETTVERLTTPTAMRMLKTLEKTQGDKVEWHIASGVVFKSKKLDANEMAAMVDRLCVAKHQEDNLPAKPHAVKLVYEENKETYVPVKEVTKEENISYMSELYSRCQETRAKTQQTLKDKYLQPLIVPKPKKAA